MKTYKKRIAILWTSYSMKDNNGVYHFVRSFLKIAQANNWKVDILFDKESSIKGKNSYSEMKGLGARLLFPSSTIEDKIQQYYSFTVGVSAIELANLQACLLESLQKNLYDLIICEPMFVNMVPQLSSLNIPVLWYTHPPGSITGNYNDGHSNESLFNYLDSISKNCIVGTQTEYNRSVLEKRGINATVLPLPFPDLEIFTQVSIPKKGILFCGTTEDRKQFKKFFDLIVKTKLPAKIMTSEKSGSKMLKMLNDAGITDVEVRSHILGEEKRDFFASSKIFFTPSYSESFGYALAEAIPHCHAVAFDYDWTSNFNKKFCHIIPQTNYIDYIKNLYEADLAITEGSLGYIESMHKKAQSAWADFINNSLTSAKTKTFYKGFAETHVNFWLSDLPRLIKRPILTLDEINPLADRLFGGRLSATYTDDETWISLDNTPPIEKEVDSFTNLFG